MYIHNVASHASSVFGVSCHRALATVAVEEFKTTLWSCVQIYSLHIDISTYILPTYRMYIATWCVEH